MTQTASISSINKKAFLNKTIKGFGSGNPRIPAAEVTPPVPVPENDENKEPRS